MRLSLTAGFALLALALCLFALSASVTGEVDVGVVPEDPGGLVQRVDVGLAAWNAGIRVGQRVVELTPASGRGGWALETTDGISRFRVSSESANAPLRITIATSALAVLLALVSIQSVRTRRRRSEATAVLAIVLAASPFVVWHGSPAGGLVVAASALVPPLSLYHRQGLRRSTALTWCVGAIALIVGWQASLGQDGMLPGLLSAGWGALLVAGAALVLVRWTGMTSARFLQLVSSIRFLDGLALTAGVVGILSLLVAGVPAGVALGVPLILVFAYTRTRHAIASAIDQILLAELREQTRIRATEAERARVSRELHDDPLQAIAGVIQQLEDAAPDTASARRSLRDVAVRLRGVATELYPPVLDDLGLAPAIEDAASHAGGEIPIAVLISNEVGYARADRPPSEVELAAFRIVQEAISNAVRHSQGTRVEVVGQVRAKSITLDVADDGIGISAARIRDSMREGHLGVGSMRRRADAIDATLEVSREGGRGTRVSLRWSA